jgi:hypothetical protein
MDVVRLNGFVALLALVAACSDGNIPPPSGGTLCENVMADEALFLGCVNACVEDQAPGLSSECAGCYGDLAWCAGTACNTWCASRTLNACTPDCTADSVQCPGYSACLTELNQCAGRDSRDCLDDT